MSFSVENKTYKTAEIALNFQVNEPTSSIIYCLDNNKNNITIAGNTTLTALTVGAHNLTVYAWDVVGNIGASPNIDFAIVQETELEPEPFPATFVTTSIISVVVIAAGLLVFFTRKKRKH